MSDATTTNRGYPYPNGKDFIPNGPVEMEAIVNALDEENRGEIDHLQAGVTLSTDWSFTAALESTSECKLESAATTGGVCWLPLTAIGLVRSVTTAAKIKALKPASLPGNGKYMTVGFELMPSISDGAATVSIVAGTEEATQKLAEEHVPATTAGKVRIRNIVILNTAGTYSITAQTDVRPWCTGGTVAETKEEGKIGAGTVTAPKVGLLSIATAAIQNAAVTAAKLAAEAVEAAAIKKEAITAEKLASEAVTDAKVAKGRALVETESQYGAPTARTSGEEYEPSTSRPTEVVLTAEGASNTYLTLQVYIGENALFNTPLTIVGAGENNITAGPVTFKVQPKEKWKAVVTATGGHSIHSSYRTL